MHEYSFLEMWSPLVSAVLCMGRISGCHRRVSELCVRSCQRHHRILRKAFGRYKQCAVRRNSLGLVQLVLERVEYQAWAPKHIVLRLEFGWHHDSQRRQGINILD